MRKGDCLEKFPVLVLSSDNTEDFGRRRLPADSGKERASALAWREPCTAATREGNGDGRGQRVVVGVGGAVLGLAGLCARRRGQRERRGGGEEKSGKCGVFMVFS